MIDKLKNKSVAYWVGAAGALIALIGLIIYMVYVGRGGSNLAAVYIVTIIGIGAQVGLFFYDGEFGGLIGAVTPIMFTLAIGIHIEADYGNIVDQLNGIRMYGNPDLASMNFVIAAFFIISIIVTVTACFMRKNKKTA